MTPHELNLHIHAYQERMKVDSEERLTLAYLTAAWSRAAKLPNLKTILAKVEHAQKPKKAQTPEQMLEFIKRMQQESENS